MFFVHDKFVILHFVMIERQSKIIRTSVVGILANVALAAFKAGVGLLANSIAVVLDAVNNLSDALSSVITIVGMKLASKPADKEHPFGHGRIEYFTALIIALIVLAAGVTSLIESVKKILNPEPSDFTVVSLIIIGVAIFVKLVLGRYVKRAGEEVNSDALIASGEDARFDAVISLTTLISAGVMMLFGLQLDGWLGAAIALVIIKAGVEMVLSPISELLGNRNDSQFTHDIKQEVESVPGVLGAYDLVLHNYGPEFSIGSVHVEVEDTITAADIYKMSKDIQRRITSRRSIRAEPGSFVRVPFGST
jgi:cation diffusion facilitator family transporter